MEVLAAADKLQLADLRDHCVAFLEANICVSNVCNVFNASRYLGLAELETQSLDFLLRNAGSAMKSSGMKHLPKDALLSMVEGDNLNADEEVVFTALVGWCEANKSNGQSVKDEFAAFLPSFASQQCDTCFFTKHPLDYCHRRSWCRHFSRSWTSRSVIRLVQSGLLRGQRRAAGTQSGGGNAGEEWLGRGWGT
jgi:hypothetical protein